MTLNCIEKKNPVLTICALSGLFLGLLLTLNHAVTIVGAGLFLLGYIKIIYDFRLQEERSFVIKIYTIGFLTRIFISLLFYFISFAKGGYGFLIMDDGIDASYNGWHIARLWHVGEFFDVERLRQICLSTRIGPHHFLTAFVYYFTGWEPLVMFIINCFIGAYSAVLIYKIAKAVFGEKTAMISALFYIFWPSTFLWSTANSKEPLTIMLILFAVLACVNLKQRFSLWDSVFMVTSLFLLSRFRTVIIAIVLSAVIILSFLFSYGRKKWKLLLRITVISAILFLFVVTKLKIFTWGGGFYQLSLVGNNIFEAINYSHYVQTFDANSAFLPGVYISTPLRVIIYFPLALFYVLFAPFPWSISSPLQMFGAFEMLLWYGLMFFFLRGCILAVKKYFVYASVLLFFVVFNLVMLALLEGNIGTMFRHRSHIIPFFLIFAAAGLNQIIEERRRRIVKLSV